MKAIVAIAILILSCGEMARAANAPEDSCSKFFQNAQKEKLILLLKDPENQKARWDQVFGSYKLERWLYEPLFRRLVLNSLTGDKLTSTESYFLVSGDGNQRTGQRLIKRAQDLDLLDQQTDYLDRRIKYVIPSPVLWPMLIDYFTGEGSTFDLVQSRL